MGHSVSGIIGLLASLQAAEYFAGHVMVCPSPCFLNVPPDYEGGFEHQDLQDLIDLMNKNYIGWANYLAPLVMGSANGAALASELSGSFCSTDPVVVNARRHSTDQTLIVLSLFDATQRDTLYQELVETRRLLEETAITLQHLSATDELTGLLSSLFFDVDAQDVGE